ncbi:MAG TPA: hypothetical protein VNN17_12580 [Terriglobia bacterium]|nr:hypothetical protein [Terriglobia bacterium]
MRVSWLWVAVLLAGNLGGAQEPETLARYSTLERQRSLTSYNGPQSRLAGWIYTDKYVYQPGEQITLKLTLKPNDDLYPYVVIAYRQNNQTGAKTYLPGNTSTVTDIDGNTREQGFQPRQLSAVTKQTIATITAPNELGMHTFVYQLRDYTGTRVLKAMYMKIGVVNSVQTLSGPITSDRTLTNDTQWNISGRVSVKDGATLTIEPGTFLFGLPGSQPPSLLLITRTGKIVANGTKSRPIIMTSSLPFGQRNRGDWGGLVMLGTSHVNVGSNQSGNNAAGTFFIEGLVGDDESLYGGGATPNLAHNCGTLRYVRVEFAGSILSPNNEVNSFTWGACGTDTVAEYLQAKYGLDDAFEWFGGTMNARYLIGGLGADDFVDFQLGYTGKIQFGLMYQSPDAKGNRGVEGDNSEFNQGASPASNPTIYNMTFIGSGQVGFDEASSPGLFLRRGARATINNTVVTRFFSPAVSISDSATQAQADAGNVKMDGILMFNNNSGTQGANTVEGQLGAGYTLDYANGQKGNGAGKNFIAGQDPLLNNPFEYSDPDFMARFGSPIFRAGAVSPPDDGFFDQSANFLGGIGAYDWTEEWTNFHTDQDVAP